MTVKCMNVGKINLDKVRLDIIQLIGNEVKHK